MCAKLPGNAQLLPCCCIVMEQKNRPEHLVTAVSWALLLHSSHLLILLGHMQQR